MVIDFEKNAKKLFSKVFYEVRKAKTRYVVVKGGSGSSKSYSVHQSELMNIMQATDGDTLVLRKHGPSIKESTYKLFTTLIDKYELGDYFKCNYSNDNRRIMYKPTGRYIVFRGLDDPEKVKSITGFKRIILEEASEFTFEDFTELTRRVRGIEGIQIILILNPISENHWIKTQLCDNDAPYRPASTVLTYTYLDNVNGFGQSFLTPEDIQELQRLKMVDENQYRIYVLGEWGIENKEGKFCWAFTRSQIKSTVYDDTRLLWLTFDFNVNPLTCTIAQVFPEMETVRAIECIKLENSDIYRMCSQIKAKYPHALYQITGDATGQSRSALTRDNITYYEIIRRELNVTLQQIKVPTVNPSIEENQILVNAVHRNWCIEVDPDRCAALIYDLTYVEVNGRGEIIKDRTSTKKFADFLDNWRYLINIAVKPHFMT
jgi:phage terminase large subunit